MPLLVINNKPGKDAEVLKRFGEPAWNYQVIRFLNAKGSDIIPRKDRVWTLPALTKRMIAALESQKRPVPKYLRALASDAKPAGLSKAAFAMACFWTGEMKLGQIDGVVRTEAGWLDGREVTKVDYDPAKISMKQLINKAANVDCAQRVYLPSDVSTADRKQAKRSRLVIGVLDHSYRRAKDSDQKRQLRGTAVSRLSLTPIQATKVNAWLRVDVAKAKAWLGPSQRRLLAAR